MKALKVTLWTALCSLFALSSCCKEAEFAPTPLSTDETSLRSLPSQGYDLDLGHQWDSNPAPQTAEDEPTIIGDELPNPYSVETMRAAAQAINLTPPNAYRPPYPTPIREIKDNAIYVRFLPKNKHEYDYLMETSGLELFDYPLHKKIIKLGSYYKDPSLSQDQPYTWLYTTVMEHQKDLYKKLEKDLPTLKCEILDFCYIPPEKREPGTPIPLGAEQEDEYNEELERKAFELVGLVPPQPSHQPSPNGFWDFFKPKAGRPEGRVTIYDKDLQKDVPLSGVKVRTSLLVKWSTTYTNDNGYYKMPISYYLGPFYTIIFEQRSNFSIYKGVNFFYVSRDMIGFRSKYGHDIHYDTDDYYWRDATIHNRADYYLKMCDRERIPRPPINLKIWQWNAIGAYAAPMLPRIVFPVSFKYENLLKAIAANLYLGELINAAIWALRSLTPDIVIGAEKDGFTNTIFHELSHASHFSAEGSAFWSLYISHILTYAGYGSDDSGTYSGICALGEIWAYSMGNILEKEYKNTDKINYKGYSYWFQPEGITLLLNNKTLTKLELFKAIIKTIPESRENLRKKLCEFYPDKTKEINKAFEYDITPNN